MNAVERLTLLSKIHKAMENEDFGLLALALGMDNKMFDDLPLDELIQIINVRLSNILRGIQGE